MGMLALLQERSLQPSRNKEVPLWFLFLTFTLHQYRRRGVGKAVLEHWKRLARDGSAQSLQLLVRPSSVFLRFFRTTCEMAKVCERKLRVQARVENGKSCGCEAEGGLEYAHMVYVL